MNDLNRLDEFIAEANSTNSSNEKVAIIKKYPDLQKMFKYVYDEQIQFGVTSKNVKKQGIVSACMYSDIYSLLDALAERQLTGHDAIGQINGFIKAYGHDESVLRIIDKDLKTRTDSSLINKAFPDCIPTFDVALAKVYADNVKKVNFKKDVWFASRKLDGLRLITVIDSKGEPRFWSRTGKEFFSLSVLGESIKKLGLKETVLDGELCLMDENGVESFKGIIKQARKQDYTVPNPMYNVFDMLTPEEFFSKEGKRDFMSRDNALADVMSTTVPHVRHVLQTIVQDEAHFEALRQEGREKGWEGIVIRKNVPYEGKRSTNLLKVKDFQSEEYEVIRTVNGPFRIIGASGLEEEIETLSSVVILHKGYEVNVGSGFSLEERKEFYKDPSQIIGKKIEVRYFKEFQESDNGGLSLQFPTYQGLWGEDRDV